VSCLEKCAGQQLPRQHVGISFAVAALDAHQNCQPQVDFADSFAFDANLGARHALNDHDHRDPGIV
jgi:hypothetical protein